MRRRLDRFVREDYVTSPTTLSVYRVVLAACVLFVVAPDYRWVASFPDSFFNPPIGLTYFGFTGFPSLPFFYALNAVIVGAAVFLLAGRRPVLAPAVLCGGLLVGNAWAYSVGGKINHDILLVLAPLILVLAARPDRTHGRVAWPVALFALMTSVAMFTAAWQKLATGWLARDSQAVLAHLLQVTVLSGQVTPLSLAALQYVPPAVWELFDLATILLEAAFLATVMNRRAFRAVCACACFFHLGVALLFRITFVPNLVAYAMFVDWDGVVERCGLTRPLLGALSWMRRRSDLELVGASAVVYASHVAIGSPLRYLVGRVAADPQYVIGVFLSVVATAAALAYLFGTLRSRGRHAATVEALS